MNLYEIDRYTTDANNAQKTLQEFGVAVVPRVIDESECQQMVDGAWDYLERVSEKFQKPIRRNRPETWKSFSNLFPKHSMLLQHFQIGQSQFVWDVRQNEKVIDVFTKLWSVNATDLLVSFDGASLLFPPEITKRGWFRNDDLHVDQSFTRNDFECVQGWVTGLDVEEGDASLAFLEGSHLLHAEFAKVFNMTDKDDWFQFSQEHIDWYLAHGCTKRYIKCPKGSLVLWDSRTVHCGHNPFNGRANPNMRCVVYVSYQPRTLAPEKNLKKRIKAFEDKRMTSHWASKPKLFAKMPRTYGQELEPTTTIDDAQLTALGRRLVGYDV